MTPFEKMFFAFLGGKKIFFLVVKNRVFGKKNFFGKFFEKNLGCVDPKMVIIFQLIVRPDVF